MVARKAVKLIELGNCDPVVNSFSRENTFGPTVELIGEGPYSFYMLENLLENGVDVSYYITRGKPYGHINENSEVKTRTFTTQKGLSRVIGNAAKSIVFSLNMKIPNRVINNYKGKLWNVHASMLPEFQGVADPIEKMAKQKRKCGGVSIHLMDNDYDTGRILGQKGLILPDYLTEGRVTQKKIDTFYVKSVIPAGAKLVADILKNLENIKPQFQDVFSERSRLALKEGG